MNTEKSQMVLIAFVVVILSISGTIGAAILINLYGDHEKTPTYEITGTCSEDGIAYVCSGTAKYVSHNESDIESIYRFEYLVSYTPGNGADKTLELHSTLVMIKSTNKPQTALFTNMGHEVINGVETDVWRAIDVSNGVFDYCISEDGKIQMVRANCNGATIVAMMKR